MSKAVLNKSSITIRIKIGHLKQIVEGAWATGNMPTRMKITNVNEFAADLVRALNAEEDDGSTRVHRMFDAAINEAVEQGAFGIEEHLEQDA